MKHLKAFLVAILTTTAMTMTAQNQNPPPSVDVNGVGTVHVVPDRVTIQIRVENSADEVKGLKEKNDETVREVLRFLKKMNIAEKDIRTEYMNLTKNYDYNTKTYSFSANQSISILIRDLSKYEDLMRGLLDSGVNRIDGVSFSSSDRKDLESQARKKAIENAKMKAEEYASALGQKIGKAISVSEFQSGPEPRMKMRAMMSDAVEESDSSMALGEMEIQVMVQVKFLLE